MLVAGYGRWIDDLEPPGKSTLGALQPEEQQSYSTIKLPAKRREWLHTRLALRRLLQEAFGSLADEIRFTKDSHGALQPLLINGESYWPSISHCQEGYAVALASAPVGVDVEARRELEPLALARRFFCAREVAYLETFSGTGLVDAFLNIWTLKESLVKASGHPLSTVLRHFAFGFEESGSIYCVDEQAGVRTEAYRFASFWPTTDITLSISVKGSDHWPPSLQRW